MRKVEGDEEELRGEGLRARGRGESEREESACEDCMLECTAEDDIHTKQDQPPDFAGDKLSSEASCSTHAPHRTSRHMLHKPSTTHAALLSTQSPVHPITVCLTLHLCRPTHPASRLPTALAGLRVGYGAFPIGMMEYMWRAKQPYNVSVAAEVAACAALTNMNYLNTVCGVGTEQGARCVAVHEDGVCNGAYQMGVET